MYLSLSVEFELSWCCVRVGWKEVEAEAPLEQTVGGQSDDPLTLRLHCVDMLRPNEDIM